MNKYYFDRRTGYLIYKHKEQRNTHNSIVYRNYLGHAVFRFTETPEAVRQNDDNLMELSDIFNIHFDDILKMSKDLMIGAGKIIDVRFIFNKKTIAYVHSTSTNESILHIYSETGHLYFTFNIDNMKYTTMEEYINNIFRKHAITIDKVMLISP